MLFNAIYTVVNKFKDLPFSKILKESAKFKLADVVEINDRSKSISKLFDIKDDFFKLPYPNTTFEYNLVSTDNDEPKYNLSFSLVVNVQELSYLETQKILSNGYITIPNKLKDSKFLMFVYTNTKSYEFVTVILPIKNLFYDDAAGIRRTNKEFIVFRSEHGQFMHMEDGVVIESQFIEDIYDKLQNFIHLVYYPILETLLQINCSNVSVHKVNVPSSMISKKIKTKELPFYRYHIIDLGRQYASVNIREAVECLSQSRAMHTVRGHLKRRNNKLYYWSSHIRNKKSNRIVKKDYIC